MCEHCKLLSGDWTILAEDGETEIKIERHNKEYSLVAEGLTDIAETRINYCPMCGRKLIEQNEDDLFWKNFIQEQEKLIERKNKQKEA